MSLKELFAPFEPWLKRHARATWRPQVENSDGSLTDSKFSGTPCLPDGSWPTCGKCNQPLQLFLQLNLSWLPEDAPDFGKGLLQFFFCTNEEASCYVDCYGDPFAECQLLRLVTPPLVPTPVAVPKIENAFLPKRIIAWSRFDDVPSDAEKESLGLTLGSDDVLRCPELGVERKVTADDYFKWSGDHSFSGNKLAGWPTWVQNIEYCNCPQCDKLMDVMVFQIACDDNIPFMLADGGIGQILQCREHKDALAFVWASG